VVKSFQEALPLTTLPPTEAEPHRTPWNTFIQKTLTARKGFFAYLPLIVTLIALLTAAKVGTFFVNPDMLRYECYGTAFWFGARTSQQLPVSQCQFIPQISQYHTLPLEYPPLTFLIFSLPLLAPAIDYPLVFAILMAAMVSIVYWLFLRYGRHSTRAVYAVCLLLGSLATTLARFDIVPAGLTLLCLILAERKHWTLAYISLALGVLIKIYPIVLFPILFLAEQREQTGFFLLDVPGPLKKATTILFQTIHTLRNWRWKNALIFFSLVLGVTVSFLGLNPAGALSTFSFLFQRPFQLESAGSVLLWLTSFFGIPVGWVDSFGSLNITSPIAGVVSQVFVLLFCLGFIYILIQQWKGKMNLLQASLAALLVLVATSKVFSPQYLLWLIPLLAYSATENRRIWLYWGGISILTTLIFPIYYSINAMLNSPSPASGFLPLIMLRNGLFIFFVVAYLFNFQNLRESGETAMLHRFP
jgi:hypothetical protein